MVTFFDIFTKNYGILWHKFNVKWEKTQIQRREISWHRNFFEILALNSESTTEKTTKEFSNLNIYIKLYVIPLVRNFTNSFAMRKLQLV